MITPKWGRLDHDRGDLDWDPGVVPLLLGGGERLFDGVGPDALTALDAIVAHVNLVRPVTPR